MTEADRPTTTALLLTMYQRPGTTERAKARRNMILRALDDLNREAQGMPSLLPSPVTPETAEAP